MKHKLLWIFVFLSLLLLPSLVVAEDEVGDDIEVFGLELEKLLNLGSGILAAVLFLLTQIAYRRTRNQRLQYVSFAFVLFAVKGFLMAHELFFREWPWVDPLASVLDFAILLIFFFGMIKK